MVPTELPNRMVTFQLSTILQSVRAFYCPIPINIIASKFDDFLKDDNLLAEAQAEAIKRVVVWQLEQVMKQEALTQTELAKRLHTSRSGLKRLVDEKNTSVTLNTLANVAQVTGKKLQIVFG